MTPERLEKLRAKTEHRLRLCGELEAPIYPTLEMNVELLDYIDLLHEDLRITRQERDHAKHQALEHRKARARLERCNECSTTTT